MVDTPRRANRNPLSNYIAGLSAAVITLSIFSVGFIPASVFGDDKTDGIERIPEQPSWRPTEREALMVLDAVLGAAEQTLGWDNVYFWITVDKCTLLCEELAPAYNPNSPERNFIDRTVPELVYISTAFYDKMNAGERVNPEGHEAVTTKEKIREIRVEIKAMIERAPQTKEPIPQWHGGFVYEKWHEKRKEMLRVWLENTPEEGGE
jgi:hypothetical protein